MLIPSMDLIGGKIVQLVQGERKALEFTNFDEWIERLSGFPLVQLIDLDAAMGQGENTELVRAIVRRLPCQVGGGIRSVERARGLLEEGARRVILGSVLIREDRADANAAYAFADVLGKDALTFAIDSKAGRVAVRGWKQTTALTPQALIQKLEPFCGTFLYTHIDTEGLLQGIPLDVVRKLRAETQNRFMAAGGITTVEEVEALHNDGIDAVVGMAIYTGKMKLDAFHAASRDQSPSAPMVPRER